jgi:hypothetical protein
MTIAAEHVGTVILLITAAGLLIYGFAHEAQVVRWEHRQWVRFKFAARRARRKAR